MVRRNPFPEVGEFVVGTVKEVKDFGAFLVLDEFPGKEGFIHISEVASGWVKYVRDHVRENAKVVCKVLQVDEKRGHVDVSLKRVNEHQRREKISEWKNEQKAEKLFEMVAKELKKEVPACYEEFGFDLQESFGTLYAAFEAGALDPAAVKEAGFKGPWLTAFTKIAKENIAIPSVTVTGYVEITCPAPDGIEVVREALEAAGVTEFEDVTIDVQYVGAPRYRVRVTAPDYKVAEDELAKAADRAVKTATGKGGSGQFLGASTGA